jgi:PTH1 family peptidyl-tRNA hydrolase
LGNPGRRYQRTPHNVGFDVIELLARNEGARLRRSLRFRAKLVRTGAGDRSWMLVQPQTYMNCSGETVGPLLTYHRVDVSNLVVVLDDADLPLGRLRIRGRGGSGGHRGLRSIIEHTGTESFARVRIGVGRRGDDMVNHVLSPFSATDRNQADQAIERAADAVRHIFDTGLESAMNEFNAAS